MEIQLQIIRQYFLLFNHIFLLVAGLHTFCGDTQEMMEFPKLEYAIGVLTIVEI
jgi:hypothetical protein